MTLHEAARRKRQRAASLANPQESAPIRSFQGERSLRVIPFLHWCELCGFSKSTGERLIAAGKVKVTYLSARRIGIREDHAHEYLESCRRAGA
jgi:hypothetical protein